MQSVAHFRLIGFLSLVICGAVRARNRDASIHENEYHLAAGMSFTQVAEARASDSSLFGETEGCLMQLERRLHQKDEFRPGHLLEAFFAMNKTVSEKLEAAREESGSTSIGVLMVFVICLVCWIFQFVLEKFFTQTEAPVTESSGRLVLHALSFARFLMAWHVVLYHFAFVDDGHSMETSAIHEPWALFTRWGALGAPWFFMVSGFSNSYSKLVGPEEQRSEEEDFVHAMVKRVFSWYPFFLIALIWCALRLTTADAEDWAHFTANMTLIHGWIWRDAAFPFLTGDVWLSWLAVYLLTWAPMHSALNDGGEQARDRTIWTVFHASCWVAIPSAFLEWYFIGTVPLFAMMQLWPSFVFGQALAFWFVKNCMQEMPSTTPEKPVWERKEVKAVPAFVRFGVTLSFLTLGTIFFTVSPDDPVPVFQKPVLPLLQKGLQLPLQGLMVVGLASEIDPIAKLFSMWPLPLTEKFALMTYIFQVPVHNTISDVTDRKGMTWTFVFTLAAFSVAAHYLLEQPYRRWQRLRVRGEDWQENGALPKK